MRAQVYRFERLQPLSYYAHAEQAQPMTGLLWGSNKDAEGEALRSRCQMVRHVIVDSQRSRMIANQILFSSPYCGSGR